MKIKSRFLTFLEKSEDLTTLELNSQRHQITRAERHSPNQDSLHRDTWVKTQSAWFLDMLPSL